MSIPQIVLVRTMKGYQYADYIGKELNLKGCTHEITDIKSLQKLLRKKGCSPRKTLIHTRTAHPKHVYKILKELEGKGYETINSSEAIKLTSDKYNSCVHAKQVGIACAETINVSKKQAISIMKKQFEKWPEIIVKPRTSQGEGAFCFKFDKNNEASYKIIKSIPTEDLVMQKFINYSKLNRVIVVNYKAVKEAVLWDKPQKHDWKCSVCLNPNIKHYKKPPLALLKFAENAARKFKAEVSFIDVFTTKGGYILSEINTACNLTIHERISKFNISKKIADYLLKHYAQRKML